MASNPPHSSFWVVLNRFFTLNGGHSGNHCPRLESLTAPAPDPEPGPQGLGEGINTKQNRDGGEKI